MGEIECFKTDDAIFVNVPPLIDFSHWRLPTVVSGEHCYGMTTVTVSNYQQILGLAFPIGRYINCYGLWRSDHKSVSHTWWTYPIRIGSGVPEFRCLQGTMLNVHLGGRTDQVALTSNCHATQLPGLLCSQKKGSGWTYFAPYYWYTHVTYKG